MTQELMILSIQRKHNFDRLSKCKSRKRKKKPRNNFFIKTDTNTQPVDIGIMATRGHLFHAPHSAISDLYFTLMCTQSVISLFSIGNKLS